MTTEARSKFVYVTYIRTTPDALWNALTTTEFMKSYFFGMAFETDWKVGSPWTLPFKDGTLADSGEILEVTPLKRLVLSWRNERPELAVEGHGRCTIDLERQGDAVKLTVLHEIDRPASKMIEAVSGGWPRILSNLKSLLETGTVVLS